QNELTTVYVPQEPEFDLEASVFEVVASGLSHAQELLDEYEQVAHKLAEVHEGREHDALMARMNSLQSSLDLTDAWNWQTRVATTLQQIGLDGDVRSGSLSGGMK